VSLELPLLSEAASQCAHFHPLVQNPWLRALWLPATIRDGILAPWHLACGVHSGLPTA
jgi:hypothetical protein